MYKKINKYLQLIVYVMTFIFLPIKALSSENGSSGYFKVDDQVSIYYEIYGDENGIPLLVLHGGPGIGLDRKVLSLIDLTKYRVVLFDQRGCGKSTPGGVYTKNNTQNLIEDIYKLKNYLNIDKFVLFGHSWGSTLGLVYAQKYPETLEKLVVSGIFLGRKQDDEWFLNSNKLFFPDWFEDFAELAKDKNDMVTSYYNLLCREKNPKVVAEAAARFWNFGIPSADLFLSTTELESKKTAQDMKESDIKNIQIFLTYAKNLYYLNENEWLTRNSMSVLDNIPTVIIKGRYDFDSPLEQGYTLSKLLPNARFIIVEGAGHNKFSKANSKVIREALQ